MTRARRVWVIGIAAALAVVLALGAVVLYRWQMPNVRARLVRILSEELGARVELADLQVHLGPVVQVVGTGLVLHHKAVDASVPPLVRVERFAIAVPVLAILRSPIHVRSVSLERLEIFVPKRGAAAGGGQNLSGRFRGSSPVVIDHLRSQNARLAIQSSKPDREPRTFVIHDLTLVDAAFDRPVRFEASLTNPKPRGEIEASGQFGPWVADDPSQSRVAGDYHFARADLGTIKGIGGTLESRGAFTGPLDQIEVKGTTTTPDFSLDIGGQPLSLSTTFTALVDGTNGDTILHDVVATLGKTPIRAKGGIVHTPGRKGRTVVLHATIDQGQLPDVLRLALDDQPPPMNGQLTLRSLINLPPGEPRVADRLELNGEFTIDGLTFASDTIQSKIDEFSRRGRGRPNDAVIQNVPSGMRGAFQLENGMLRFSSLRFVVRGARVQLHGTYRLRGSALDFRGSVRLEARASQTVTGWKAWVLKPFDSILAKEGAGTVLPITITGTAKQPKFGVEMKKIF